MSQVARCPTILQMEAVECGAASLAMILAYYKKWVPLEQIRVDCGVSRDGSNAGMVVKTARLYGLEAKGYSRPAEALRELPSPFIIFWHFNHFMVVEGIQGDRAWVNDPASGRRPLTFDELNEGYSGIALTFKPGPDFQPSGRPPSVVRALLGRLHRSSDAVAFVILASLGLVLPGLVLPALSAIFVDEILIRQLGDWMRPLLLGLVLTGLARLGLTWLQQRYLLRLETRINLLLSSQLLWQVLRLPMSFFDQRFAGDITARFRSNDRVSQILSSQLTTNALNLFSVFFFGLVMFFYSTWLALIAVSLAVINLAVLARVARTRVESNARILQDLGHLVGTTMNGIRHIETLKSTGAETPYFARWAGYQAKVYNGLQKLNMSTQAVNILPVLLNGIGFIAILGTGSYLVMQGEITMGMLVAFQSLNASFSEPILQLVQSGGVLQELKGDIARLDDVLHHPLDGRFDDADDTDRVSDLPAKLSGRLELEGLTFGYARAGKTLIKDLDLNVPAGARVALVGRSGSGKSTIGKLVSGQYPPWSGVIRLDGTPLSDVPLPIFNNSVAVIDSSPFLFEGTVRENLTLWNPRVDEEALFQSLRDACIDKEVLQRPGGLDSRVMAAGQNFSGGQRQRLEIARALTAEPSLLIMDEATSALDPPTEQAIDLNLRRRGTTCVIIAHRLSTIRDSDEILVLDCGEVVQRGRHELLIEQPGLYRDLILAEAAATN